MNTTEAAERLGMPVQAVRCLMRAGKLPIGTVYKGKKEWCYHIHEQWLERYLQGNPVRIDG